MSLIPVDTMLFGTLVMVLAFLIVAWMVTDHQRRFGRSRHARAGQGLQAGLQNDLREREVRRRWPPDAKGASREQRAAPLRTTRVSAADAARFSHAWTSLQCRFVDNPQAVVAEADQLVRELLDRHGYPMDAFDRPAAHENELERRFAENSGEHPTVVTTYLAARAITRRNAGRAEADTEVLRKAVVYYRTLFQELFSGAAGKDVSGNKVTAPTSPTFSLHT